MTGTRAPIESQSLRTPLPWGSGAELIASFLVDRYRVRAGDNVGSRKPFRTLAIVGAGASHAACGLPLGAELSELILNHLIRKKNVTRAQFRDQLIELRDVEHLRPADFETRLHALSQFDAGRVVEKLQKHCLVAHYPSLTYEVLAHLLKHGFLDAIINFNFDELLDQAVDEELGRRQYARIVMAGDCARELSRGNVGKDGLSKPLYIKPHGSASEPESLRFTRRQYFEMPRDIRDLLKALIEGRPVGSRTRGKSRPSPVCVLVFGHALQSFEVNRLFERVDPRSKLITVSPEWPRQDEWPKRMQDIMGDSWIQISPAAEQDGQRIEPELDQFVRECWKTTETTVRATKLSLTVRGIQRHELVAQLFSITRLGVLLRRPGSAKLATYLADRALVELALAIAKSKGFVDLREVERGRPGRLIRLLKDTSGHSRVSVRSLLVKLGMEQRESTTESYWHSRVPTERTARGAFRLTLKSGEEIEMCRELVKCCERELSERRRHRLTDERRKLLLDTLIEMFRGDEVEIADDGGERFRGRFTRPQRITTLAEMHRLTRQMLHRRWALLLCVAESGKWLLNFRDVFSGAKGRRRQVAIVVADGNPDSDEVKAAIPNVTIVQIPWYLHNRHATICLTTSPGGTLEPKSAIVYDRRYRSGQILPTFLTTNEDRQRALDDFVVYWLKAERYQEGKSEVITLTKSEMVEERQRLLRRLRHSRSITPGDRTAL